MTYFGAVALIQYAVFCHVINLPRGAYHIKISLKLVEFTLIIKFWFRFPISRIYEQYLNCLFKCIFYNSSELVFNRDWILLLSHNIKRHGNTRKFVVSCYHYRWRDFLSAYVCLFCGFSWFSLSVTYTFIHVVFKFWIQRCICNANVIYIYMQTSYMENVCGSFSAVLCYTCHFQWVNNAQHIPVSHSAKSIWAEENLGVILKSK